MGRSVSRWLVSSYWDSWLAYYHHHHHHYPSGHPLGRIRVGGGWLEWSKHTKQARGRKIVRSLTRFKGPRGREKGRKVKMKTPDRISPLFIQGEKLIPPWSAAVETAASLSNQVNRIYLEACSSRGVKRAINSNSAQGCCKPASHWPVGQGPTGLSK